MIPLPLALLLTFAVLVGVCIGATARTRYRPVHVRREPPRHVRVVVGPRDWEKEGWA